jgi:hypothetical protein
MVLIDCPWCAAPLPIETAARELEARCDACLVLVEVVTDEPAATLRIPAAA